MRKRQSIKLAAVLLAVWLMIVPVLPVVCAAAEELNAADISNEEEFRSFAQSCSLDTWSQGKTFKLTADLDLMGAEFVPIPTFGGVFLGQGHVISGLSVTNAGSVQGLFRYVQAGGVVRDLSVEGTVAPGGSRSTVGGIVGDNSGTIQNCSFRGTVQGEDTVGGIAGRNNVSGEILQCRVSGAVSGSSATGGIAGRSMGLLLKCESGAGVNLTQSESGAGSDAGAALEERAAADGDMYHLLSGCTDTGGIVGWSSGVVQSCTNSGAVGYPHVGYNTGGIAGRQSGYLAGCVNNGTINGRKDVGGVVGQAEPFLLADPREDAIDRLRGELDVMDYLINQTIHDVQNTGDDVSIRLEAMGGFTNDARDNSQAMLDYITDFADSSVNSVNTVAADLTDTLDKMNPALEDLSAAGKKLEELSGHLGEAMEALDGAVDIGGRSMTHIRAAVEDLRQAGRRLNTSAEDVQRAMDQLLDKALHGSQADQDAALNELKMSISALGSAFSHLSEAIEDLKESIKAGLEKPDHPDAPEESEPPAGPEPDSPDNPGQTDAPDASDTHEPGLPDLTADLPQLPGSGGSGTPSLPDLPGIPELPEIPELPDMGDINVSAVLDALEEISNALSSAFDALERLSSSLPALNDVRGARDTLKKAMDGLRSSGDSLDSALSGIQNALGNSGELSGQLGEALEQLQKVSNSSAGIGRILSRAFDMLSDAVNGLTAKGPMEFVPLGEQFQEASEGLFDALGGLSGEMDRLNSTARDWSGTLSADMRAVNSQFHTVVTVMLDAAAGLTKAADDGVDTVLQDTSEEDIAATREGKVTGCRSSGAVEGDRNVGGIVGSMAIEFDLDPEDDSSGIFSFGATYETKAVLQDCINYGGVTAKKDCAGGLVGRMDLGTALDSQNYGPVESTGGDYVGGAAGYAGASVRSCWAKCTLSGGSYVGGIAGWASRLRDCRAIASIAGGAECLGAIAGGMDADGILSGCCFVNMGVAGVDGVSYAHRAEPVPFEEMAALSGIPDGFTAFTLTLVADGRTVAQIPFLYGEDLSRVSLPEAPELDGSYGAWPEFDMSGTNSDVILEAVYAPWITLAASEERSGQLSLALAEGQFTDEAELHVADSAQTPPKKEAEGAVVWDVALTGSGVAANGQVPLRLLSPSGGDADVWQYKNGQWVAVDAQRSGQYLLLAMEGPQGTFFLLPKQGGAWKFALPAAGGAAGAALLAAVLAKLHRKKKKSGKKKETAPTAES